MSVAGCWWLPPLEAFLRLSKEYTRAQGKQEAREGDDGNSYHSTSSPLSLIINSNIPPKMIASELGRGSVGGFLRSMIS